MNERREAWMRILVLIVSGIILTLWKVLIQVMMVIHWIMIMFTRERNKDLAEFSEIWNTQLYIFMRYMTFSTNKRPFPFNPLTKSMSKYVK